jgi:hypothetical protein
VLVVITRLTVKVCCLPKLAVAVVVGLTCHTVREPVPVARAKTGSPAFRSSAALPPAAVLAVSPHLGRVAVSLQARGGGGTS